MKGYWASTATAESFGNTMRSAENMWGAQEGLIPGVENLREMNVRVFEMARANSDAAFAFACDVVGYRNPKDFIDAWTTHATKQIDMLMKQAGELTSLGQWIAKHNGGFGL